VRDQDRLPDDSFQGFSDAFTGLLVAGQPVRARYCGVCQLWFGSAKDQFMDPVRARQKHCRDDPGHVSRAAHAQQLQRKQLSRAKTKATGRAEDSWENASERFRSESTSQWDDAASEATSNTAEREHAERLQQNRPRTAQRAAIGADVATMSADDIAEERRVLMGPPPARTEAAAVKRSYKEAVGDVGVILPDCCGAISCHGLGPECIGRVWEADPVTGKAPPSFLAHVKEFHRFDFDTRYSVGASATEIGALGR
jgi:hypothetical protein